MNECGFGDMKSFEKEAENVYADRKVNKNIICSPALGA